MPGEEDPHMGYFGRLPRSVTDGTEYAEAIQSMTHEDNTGL